METVTLAALHSSFSHSKNASSLLVSAPSINHPLKLGVPGGAIGKGPACQCRRCKRRCFDLRVGKIPQRRAWQSTPVFLPGESYGQRSLAGYSPWGHKELDTTERLTRKWFCILIVVVVIRVCTWIITHIHHTNVNFLVLILYDYLQCNHWERLGDWV